MSKYTTEQLQEMAWRVQERRGTTHYVALLISLCMQFRLTLEQVKDRIDLLAAGLPVTH
ncbi:MULTISPECIES: hypothetical protein [Gammaproteobacteria]|uniref:hypothetical protein n=1 Tax=Gammaproteobacteria TaxID=1236 RepID=UPI0037A2CEF7